MSTRFKSAVRLFIVAQEILVDRASYPIKSIAENSHAFRTLGLGYANLGALIMSRGLGYDSDEGRTYAGAITALMTGHAYRGQRGNGRRQRPLPFLSRRPLRRCHPSARTIQRTVDARSHRTPSRTRGKTRRPWRLRPDHQRRPQAWDRALADGRRHGYRNAQVTVLAPTGTIGFLMDCDTTGIEPDIALVKYKLLAGGGMLKIVNRTVPPALKRLGYTSDEIAAILIHIEKYDTIEDVIDRRNRQDRFPAA